jgi:hypothetical protein
MGDPRDLRKASQPGEEVEKRSQQTSSRAAGEFQKPTQKGQRNLIALNSPTKMGTKIK